MAHFSTSGDSRKLCLARSQKVGKLANQLAIKTSQFRSSFGPFKVRKSQIRRQIGRRYATILLQDKIRILVNGDPCEPFEHCVWDDSRSLERRELGKISAVFRFNEVVGT